MAERVLITGASSDVGVALARALLATPEVTVVAHSFRGGARIEQLQAEFGERVEAVQADFSSLDEVRAMAERVLAGGVPLKMVHLPALRLQNERLTKFDFERFHRDMAVQVESLVVLLAKFAPKMAKMEGSRVVVMVTSNTHGMPAKFMSLYTVVKYAQLGLVRAAAAEYAGTHLTVNAVSPSMIDTQFLGEISEIMVNMAAAAHPKGRNAKVEDVLGAMEFLLSPGAGYMTGADLPITGGTHI